MMMFTMLIWMFGSRGSGYECHTGLVEDVGGYAEGGQAGDGLGEGACGGGSGEEA